MDQPDALGNRAIHWATVQSSIRIILITHSRRAIDALNDEGLTPLAIAPKNGVGQAFETLVTIRADMDALDKNGNSIIHMACEPKETGILHHLLSRGKFRSVQRNNNGQTPLHHAIEIGNVEAVKLLLEFQAALNPSDLKGQTPLMTAVKAGNKEICELLINCSRPDGEKVDINKGDVNGDTPLHICSRKDDVAIGQLLIRQGANKNAENNEGLTPITVIPCEQRYMSAVYHDCCDATGSLDEVVNDLFNTGPVPEIQFLE